MAMSLLTICNDKNIKHNKNEKPARLVMTKARNCGGRCSLLACSRSQQCARIYGSVCCASGIKTSSKKWCLLMEHEGLVE